VCPPTCRASETTHRLSARPGCVEERRGPPRVQDHPLRTCHGRTPRRIHPLLCPENDAGDCYGLQVIQDPRHPERREVSGPHAPRPARSHAYASPSLFPSKAHGWLPARAGSPLAGQDAHLLDDTRRFVVASHLPVPFDPQGLVALNVLSARPRFAALRLAARERDRARTRATETGPQQAGECQKTAADQRMPAHPWSSKSTAVEESATKIGVIEYTYCVHASERLFPSLLKHPQQYGCPFLSDGKVSRRLGASPFTSEGADHRGQHTVNVSTLHWSRRRQQCLAGISVGNRLSTLYEG